MGTIAPPPSSISPGAHATSNTTTPFSSFYNDGATSKGAAAPAAAAALRASFVSQVLSVPLLPSRLGGGGGVGGGGVGNGSVGIGLLIRDRTECFVDCLRDFCDETMIPLEARTSTTTMPAAAGGGSGDSHCCTAADSTTKSSGGSSNNGTATAAVGRGGHRVDWRGLCDLPPPPVSCCSTETFLLGNIVAMGTNLQQSTAAAVVDDGGGKEAATGERGRGTKRRTLRKQELEFMRTVTKLLELEVRERVGGGRKDILEFFIVRYEYSVCSSPRKICFLFWEEFLLHMALKREGGREGEKEQMRHLSF